MTQEQRPSLVSRSSPFRRRGSDQAGAIRGRGVHSNRTGRFEREVRSTFHDGWADDEAIKPTTSVHPDPARHIITRNNSPDIPFDRSINPYRGCEHGCVYCFARPSHNYLGLSAGLDFETELFAKMDAAELLRKELAKKSYKVAPIAIGTNTDPYQPLEKTQRITRSILEVLLECKHPVTIVTKSRLIVRDLDILKALSQQNLVRVTLSVTTLDPHLARKLEPRASTPQKRLDAIKLLSEAGVPTGVFFAPVIPGLTDHEVEWIIKAAGHAGATSAGYITLRLPGEVAELFGEWLDVHAPAHKDKILGKLKAARGGRLNDPRFVHRMRGRGVESLLFQHRFEAAVRREGLAFKLGKGGGLNVDAFKPPLNDGCQLALF